MAFAGVQPRRIMVSHTVTVTDPLGLHARAAARFVHTASRFASQIHVARDSRVMDGKSILGLLLLAAGTGTSLTISAEGPDEEAALATLCRFVERGFQEDPWSA